MCGIFGILSHQGDRTPDDNLLKRTATLLQHRGPDGFGIYSERNVGLVHTRLSLLDLSDRSNQPFWDKQRRYCLVYNGEIYNFRELRAELEKQDIQFRTTSDTEVLLESIVNCGVDATLPLLEGMFAFVLYDSLEKTFVLARDRFGIKPLFIYDTADSFVFASEIKAMQPWIKFEPDILSISSFLHGFSGPTKGFTFLKNIRLLDPGVAVRVSQGKSAAYRQFFSMSDFYDPDEVDSLQRLKPQQLVDRLDESLNESTRSQLLADAPVGALCSGGVDSSVIIAMASKYHNNLAIFHANVVGPLSEYDAALRLANHLRIDLKAVDIHDQDFILKMPEVIEHYGLPFYPRPHSIPYLLVSMLAHDNNVKALLCGEGADECYLGYSSLAPNIREWIHPRLAARHLKTLIKSPLDTGKFKYFGLKYVGGGDPETDSGLVTALHNRFEVVEEAVTIRNRLRQFNESRESTGLLQSLDLLNYNLRSALLRDDLMGMAASIEARFPFLDTKTVKLALNMPYNRKIRFSPTVFEKRHYFFRDKWVLRKIADRYLPHALSQREKKPFEVNAYSARRFQIAPAYFDQSFISDLFSLSTHSTHYLIDKASHDLKLKLLQLDIWAQLYLFNLSKSSVLHKLLPYLSFRSKAAR